MTSAFDFSRLVDDVLAGRAGRDSVLILGDIPALYVSLGVPRFKLAMTQATLGKIMAKHNLSISTIKNLPVLLRLPVMVFRSATEPGALVSMINATDKNRNAIIVIIHPDRQHKQHRINLIASAYGKDRAHWFNEQIEKGRLLYMDKEKALRWSRSARLQLPGEVTAARHKTSLPRPAQNVKDNPRHKNPENKGNGNANQ